MDIAHLVEEPETATVKSARRALLILELFGRERRQMSTTDIAMLLDLPISSTAALLKSLTSQGYLVFDRQSRIYGVSLRVGFLGGWMHRASEGFGRLDAAIDRLAEETGRAVILGVRNDFSIQYVKVESRGLPFALPVGSRQRLVDTVMGRSLLAGDDDRAIERLVRRANAERPCDRDPVDLTAIRAEIATVRDTGTVFAGHAFHDGFAAAAAPIRIADTGQVAALGIVGPAEDMEPDRAHITALLWSVVREIQSPAPLPRDLPAAELRQIA
ncbi:IclR family transcriptional regulator [Chachezhania sediminis]|uniref:IclR family transcriptional regulator n=1 Tax=Chachezhania sediminis TaxID=2599291 RepID=UPI00131E80DE|nr:IclR family transcriptional regulator C-terminal domain-containing protein [Chachezhania sediminis]